MGLQTPGRPHVVHVSGDFPDPIDRAKTPVIDTLLSLTADRFDHSVISINRVTPGLGAMLHGSLSSAQLRIVPETFAGGIALSYFAPPKGFRHATCLKQLGDWIARRLMTMDRRPDLIVGHKLGIEGIAVASAAAALDLPYALSIQGDTDTKILAARPDLAPLLRGVLHGACVVFPFTPWAWQAVVGKLGTPPCPHIFLPCPTDLDEPLAPNPKGNGLVSVFHLRNFRRKNLAGIVRALEGIRSTDASFDLTIIGGGNTQDKAACERLAGKSGRIHFAGPLGRPDVRLVLNTSTALVLPSLRESFGLVFIEALFAGTPVIYPAGSAIDGYFDGLPFAIPVKARDPKSISSAMMLAVEREAELKAELAEWHHSPHASAFQRTAIADSFAKGLAIAVGDRRALAAQ